MPSGTVIERRDRALMSFIALTGCRDKAAVTVKLKHVSLKEQLVLLDAREVDTKFAKTITTYFFPVGDEPLSYFVDWIAELTSVHLWGPDDPLFPATRVARGADEQFGATGIERRHWSNAGPVRRIFKAAFANARVPYYQPHTLRHMLTRLGLERRRTPEELKARSQNLGHAQVMTTLASYGHLEDYRQGEIIKGLGEPAVPDEQLMDLFHTLVARAQRR